VKLVRLHPEAEQELEEAYDYYDTRQPGLGADLEDETEDALRRIAAMPRAFPPHGSEGARKCLLPRFPYTIYFVELDDYIWVAAVAHQKRKPDYWTGRTPE
jgi:toxin ParE1/3/4